MTVCGVHRENASLSKVEEEALEKCKQALEKCKQEISSYDKCVKRRLPLVGNCSEREQVMNDCLRQCYMETNNAVNQEGKGPAKS